MNENNSLVYNTLEVISKHPFTSLLIASCFISTISLVGNLYNISQENKIKLEEVKLEQLYQVGINNTCIPINSNGLESTLSKLN